MGRVGTAVALAALLAVESGAGTRADFTLGLTGEYLGWRQGLDGQSSDQRSVIAGARLALSGHLLDPRVLTYDLSGEFFRSTLDAGDSSSRTVSRQPGYGASLRAFSNRAVSFSVGAHRSRNDVSGVARGAYVSGAGEDSQATVDIRPGRVGLVRLERRTSKFTADDPGTLRDDDQRVTSVHAETGFSKVQATLDARRTDLAMFSRLIEQRIDYGNLGFGINRGSRDSLESTSTWTRVDTASRGMRFGQPLTVLMSHNTYRHAIEQGTWLVALDTQRSRQDGFASLSSSSLGTSYLRLIAAKTELELTGTYLRTDVVADRRVDLPSATVGLRWWSDGARWSASLYPRVSYTRASGLPAGTESAFGGGLAAQIRRSGRAGYLALEASGSSNRVTIPGGDRNAEAQASSFLAGLERERGRVRLFAEQRLGARATLSAEVAADRAVRVFHGDDITDRSERALARASWGGFRLEASASNGETTGTEVPASVRTTVALLGWQPTAWFGADVSRYQERRTALGVEGSITSSEGGIRFNYQLLSFFARVREDRTPLPTGSERRDRRVWFGVQRLFTGTLIGGPTPLTGRPR